MIDTSKYEGHTPAPWKNEGGNIHATNGEHIADTVLDMVIPQDEAYANTQLIADAPLLLAEVKRLQHAMIYVSMKIFWNENGIPYEYTQLMEYCRQHCGEPDDMSGKLGQMISEFEDEFPYQEESE